MHFDPPRPRSDDERILPLVNVVFLLLIFFMLAGQLAATDPLAVEPPRSASEGEIGERELVIVLGAEGRLALGGVVLEEAEFESALGDRLAGDSPPLVWLKADGSADSVAVISLLETLQALGVERLKLLTVPAGAGGTG